MVALMVVSAGSVGTGLAKAKLTVTPLPCHAVMLGKLPADGEGAALGGLLDSRSPSNACSPRAIKVR
jgi:hypothetical protein